ncbi:GlsB/YeaQ/YmgE family stress response membrane protein [Bacillus ndiopicus]|uniref:GlsB/YeaQ/YmgE family stress response membrane protein n=1 Tax=Bacillus ndiopicus TaxID=1347368 RepID=UPI0005A8A7AE|nr:hypothetical protein [Bacillus ndiopicus]
MKTKDKRENEFAGWLIIIWTTLLVLLLIGWIMHEFYKWDMTIVAAIIAFVGAVIGGSITLIGVNKTIKDGRERDRRKEYTENLGKRAEIKHAICVELSEMSELLSKKIIHGMTPDEDITDEFVLNLLNELDNRCKQMEIDGISIGADNFTALKELRKAIDELYQVCFDLDINPDPDSDEFEENYYFEVYFENSGRPMMYELFDFLFKPIDICSKRAKKDREKLFKEVNELSDKSRFEEF